MAPPLEHLPSYMRLAVWLLPWCLLSESLQRARRLRECHQDGRRLAPEIFLETDSAGVFSRLTGYSQRIMQRFLTLSDEFERCDHILIEFFAVRLNQRRDTL